MKISSFGEVLWDDFPGGKALGGAPLNVLVRLANAAYEGVVNIDEYGFGAGRIHVRLPEKRPG